MGLQHIQLAQLEFRRVGAERQLDLDAVPDPVFVVILGDPLSYFAGAEADNRVAVGVVVRIAGKDFDPEGTLLQIRGTAIKGGKNNIFEQGRIPLAAPEMIARKDGVEFCEDELTVLRRAWNPGCFIVLNYSKVRQSSTSSGGRIHQIGTNCHADFPSSHGPVRTVDAMKFRPIKAYFFYKLATDVSNPISVTYGINLACHGCRVKNADGLHSQILLTRNLPRVVSPVKRGNFCVSKTQTKHGGIT